MNSVIEQVRRLGLSDRDIDLNLAIGLYQGRRLGLGRAAELLGMDRLEFMGLLSERGIPLNFSWGDYLQDLKTLAALDSQ